MNFIKPICSKIILPLAALALVCGCHKEEPKPAAPATTGGGIVSAEKTSFDEVTSKLDKGGNLYVYLSTEQALGNLSAKLAGLSNFFTSLPGMVEQGQTIGKVFDFADTWIKDSGVEQISGVGMSSIAREPGFYYSKLIIHHYPGQNDGVMWSLAGKEPHPLKELDLLPETTVLTVFSDFDVPLLWQDIQKHVKQLNIPAATDALDQWPGQFQQKTKLDFDKVLGSLGGNYGMILTLDAEKKISLPMPAGAMEIPSPGLAIIVKVKSDVIFDRVDELCKGNPLVIRVDTSGLKMRTMTIPLPLPVELRPSIARSGDYLILATSDTMVHEILDVQAGKKKGFKSTAEFARLSQGIPEEGNNFSIVASQFVKSMMELQQQTLSSKGNMTQAQIDSLQQAFHSGTNYGSYSVGVNGSEGWAGYGNGTQSLQSMLVPAIAGVGVAAAVAIPNFIKARQVGEKTTAVPQENTAPDSEMAQYNRVIRNLRSIQAAKQKWAAEKGKSEGDAVTMGDLLPYLRRGPIKPVTDEVYDPQPVGALPTAKLAHDLNGHAAGTEIAAPAVRTKPPA